MSALLFARKLRDLSGDLSHEDITRPDTEVCPVGTGNVSQGTICQELRQRSANSQP